jgi:hypothetical protein
MPLPIWWDTLSEDELPVMEKLHNLVLAMDAEWVR